MAERAPPVPPPRTLTVREALREALAGTPATARELSSRVGIPERQVADHLEHLALSLEARGERLVVEPAACIGCGFVFRKRERLARPSACPRCRSTRIDPPAFRIERTR
jgi:predicted Zn-ribbon and HTH transcriptional regulator